ncbi:MAG: hypothetical protein WCA08_23345, partial [Desulfoferrobacter sp.]
LGDRQEIKEIPRAQRYPGRPPLDSLFVDIAKGDRQQRNNQIVLAHHNPWVYTKRDCRLTAYPLNYG